MEAEHAVVVDDAVFVPLTEAAWITGRDVDGESAWVRRDGGTDWFDLAGFVRTAKLNFVRVQLAIDLGKLDAIREFLMPQLFAQLSKQVVARGGTGQQTDVVSLSAELAALVTEGDTHRASVRFSGMAREKPGATPVGFAELWTLAKPASGTTGWLLASLRRAE